MFEKTLIDLVKGIRVNADKESEYISKALAEIKKELKVLSFFSPFSIQKNDTLPPPLSQTKQSTDLDIKAQALQKLVYVFLFLLTFFRLDLLSLSTTS